MEINMKNIKNITKIKITAMLMAAIAAASGFSGCCAKRDSNNAVSTPTAQGSVTFVPADENVELKEMSDEDLTQLATSLMVRLDRADNIGIIPEFNNDNRIVISGVTSSDELIELLTRKGELLVTDDDGNTVMDNNAIISAVCINSETPGEYFVKLNFTDEGMTKFSEITEAISQKEDGKNYLTFTLDGEVIAKPKIDSAVNSESVNLDGDFTVESATLIANVLSGGELPIQLKIEE
jgi:hypothetical protein